MTNIGWQVKLFFVFVRCRFAYGPADATATHYLLLIKTGFTLLVLPFWYCLTRIVPDKIQRAKNGCSSSSLFLCVLVLCVCFFSFYLQLVHAFMALVPELKWMTIMMIVQHSGC